MKVSFEITREQAVVMYGQRQVNRAVGAALRKVGEEWHNRYIRKHFTKAGAREYGYASRKGEHARAGSKRFRRIAGPAERRAGEILPLVYSGHLRAGAMTRRVQTAATSNKTVVYIVLPRAQRANIRPHMREELTTISDRERQVLVNILNREIIKQLSAMAPKRRKRIS